MATSGLADFAHKVRDNPETASSAVNIDVSSADMDNFDEQVRDTMSFLAAYDEDVRNLIRLPGIECAVLDFAIAWQSGMASRSARLPASFIALAGGIGLSVEVSCYAVA